MTRPIIAIAVATLVLYASAPPVAAQDRDDLGALRQHALELVNAARDEAGLPALDPDPVLDEAAQGHADDMVERDYYAHVGPDGRTPHDRFLAAGGSRWSLSGENIAMCSGCSPPPDIARVEAFQTGWMQSPEHRENILRVGFDSFGFGIAGEAEEIYAVQTFAGPGSDDGAPLDADGARAAALEAVNVRREDADLPPLAASEALDSVAARILDSVTGKGSLPDDLFGLLPDGATGWTSLSVQSASRGGSGSALSSTDVAAFVDDWASAEGDAPLGGARAGHLGFAAATREDGRATAVVVFGRRD